MTTDTTNANVTKAENSFAGLVRKLCAVLGAAIVLSALVGVVFVARAAMGQDVPAQTLYVLMFEPVVLVSGFFAVVVGLGLVKDGRAMSLAMCGGAVAILAVLSDTSIPSRIYGANAPSAVIGGVEIQPFAIARLIGGLVLLGMSGVYALARSGRAGVPCLVRAVVLSVPVVVGLGGGVFMLTSKGRSAVSGVSPSFVAIGLVIGSVIVGGFIAAAVHQWVRAFEVGAGDVLDGAEQAKGGSGSKAA